MNRHNFLLQQLKPHSHHLMWLPWEGHTLAAYSQPVHAGRHPAWKNQDVQVPWRGTSLTRLYIFWSDVKQQPPSFLPLKELNILTALLPPVRELWQYFGAHPNTQKSLQAPLRWASTGDLLAVSPTGHTWGKLHKYAPVVPNRHFHTLVKSHWQRKLLRQTPLWPFPLPLPTSGVSCLAPYSTQFFLPVLS